MLCRNSIKSCVLSMLCLGIIRSCVLSMLCPGSMKSCILSMLCSGIIKSCVLSMLCRGSIKSYVLSMLCRGSFKSCALSMLCHGSIKSCILSMLCPSPTSCLRYAVVTSCVLFMLCPVIVTYHRVHDTLNALSISRHTDARASYHSRCRQKEKRTERRRPQAYPQWRVQGMCFDPCGLLGFLVDTGTWTRTGSTAPCSRLFYRTVSSPQK